MPMQLPPLSRLFGSPYVVGVDVGSRFTKVAEIHAHSRYRFRVKGFASVLTPDGAFAAGVVQDPEALGRSIREAVKLAGIRTRRAAAAVPPQVAFLRKLSFPVMPEAELRNIIQLQPDRYLPIAASEAAQFDVAVLPHEPGAEQMSVILAAAPMRMVESLMQACKIAGLSVVSVDLEPLALYRAVSAIHRGHAGGVSAIVDIGASGAKLSLFDNGLPVISRVLSAEQLSAEPGQAAAEGTFDLFLDVRRSLEYALSQTQGPLRYLFLTGGGAMDEYLAVSLAGYLRGFISHRLMPDFDVVPLQHQFVEVSRAYMLAVGLSFPQELFNDSNQPIDQTETD